MGTFQNFEVGIIYPLRTYERHQFRLSIDGQEYKGDYYDETINWLNPYPCHVVERRRLDKIEKGIHYMLRLHGVKDNEMEDITLGRILNNGHAMTDSFRFKLKAKGEEFTGVQREHGIDWFYPKPEGKLERDEIGLLEKKIHERVKEYMELGPL